MDKQQENTIALNRASGHFDDHEEVWLFGYGSLIYKADFPYLDRVPAHIEGWERRFWQGSHDHRGTPEQPGRVVTLIESPGARCGGMAYKITPQEFAHLDHREKNGYLRACTRLFFAGGGEIDGLVYVADAANGAYLGPAHEADIAAHIDRSQGPSGHNRDYFLELHRALNELCFHDPHIERIHSYL